MYAYSVGRLIIILRTRIIRRGYQTALCSFSLMINDLCAERYFCMIWFDSLAFTADIYETDAQEEYNSNIIGHHYSSSPPYQSHCHLLCYQPNGQTKIRNSIPTEEMTSFDLCIKVKEGQCPVSRIIQKLSALQNLDFLLFMLSQLNFGWF